MKAIILAAGKGVRMGKYTANVPKGMLEFNGQSLLSWQLKALREGGIDEINICTGYQKEAIPFDDVNYFHNPDYAITNMVETLLCAREILNDDVLVAYADIIYTPELVRGITSMDAPISVAVDVAWRNYWQMRYSSTELDLETLTVRDNRIVELGQEVESSEGIDYRYIGLIHFRKEIWSALLDLYDAKEADNSAWKQSGKTFRNGYMTDLLNELIGKGVEVVPHISEKQWLEFDTEEDYERTLACSKAGELKDYFSWDLS